MVWKKNSVAVSPLKKLLATNPFAAGNKLFASKCGSVLKNNPEDDRTKMQLKNSYLRNSYLGPGSSSYVRKAVPYTSISIKECISYFSCKNRAKALTSQFLRCCGAVAYVLSRIVSHTFHIVHGLPSRET